MVRSVWQKIPFRRMWWADDGLVVGAEAHNQPIFVGFVLIISVIAQVVGALWAKGGLFVVFYLHEI